MTTRDDEDRQVSLSHGEVRAWIEQGTSVHLRAVTREGDPVELSVNEVKRLAAALTALAARLERDEG